MGGEFHRWDTTTAKALWPVTHLPPSEGGGTQRSASEDALNIQAGSLQFSSEVANILCSPPINPGHWAMLVGLRELESKRSAKCHLC